MRWLEIYPKPEQPSRGVRIRTPWGSLFIGYSAEQRAWGVIVTRYASNPRFDLAGHPHKRWVFPGMRW